MSSLCFVVDVNIAKLKRPLRRRGFIVYAPGEDYPEDMPDHEILEYALKLGCVVVSSDIFFMDKPNAVYVPYEWLRRYNTWDLTTKIIKHASMLMKKQLSTR